MYTGYIPALIMWHWRIVGIFFFFSCLFLQISTHAFASGGYFVIGTGAGGGGAGGSTGAAGGNGGSADVTINLATSSANNVIFGNGSGGGAGGRSVGYTPDVRGGYGGSGNNTLTGGSGNDIIFGHGFNGRDTAAGAFYPGDGGLGGGGGGAAGGNFGAPPGGATGGICGGGGGGGTLNGGTNGPMVTCNGVSNGVNATGSIGGNGGNSGYDWLNNQGLGGAYNSYNGGGGGGFGGAKGGSGSTNAQNGDTNQHWYYDASGAIYNYFTLSVLQNLLRNFPNYGTGSATINGKGGSNELFGLGTDTTFVVDSADNATQDRIWDFHGNDKLLLENNGQIVDTVDVNHIVSGATTGDYGSGVANNDTQFTYGTTTIDLIGVTYTLTASPNGTVNAVNHPPTISLNSTPLSYSPGASATQLDSAGTVYDPDGDSNWNGGSLVAQITSNSITQDTLSLSGTNITVSGTILKYNGNPVGAISPSGGSVTGNGTLTLTFDSGATNTIVQAMLQNIRFYTTTAGSANRIVTVTATDYAGASASTYREVDVAGAGSITLYPVTATAGSGGTISPSSWNVVSGNTYPFTVTASIGYSISSVTGCSGSLSGNSYTTGAINAACSITASFTPNTYTITFNTQGGNTINSISQGYNTNITLPSATRNGYTLSGWNTAADGTLTSYSPGATINMPYNGITLYAQWSSASTANSTSNSSSNSPKAPVCSQSQPTGTPNLYQLNPTTNSVTLYFTPVGNADSYYIRYGYDASESQFATSFSESDQNGAVSYTVNDLQPNLTYYFSVRGGNGCATGNWSNTASIKTNSSENTNSGAPTSYFSPTPSPDQNKKISIISEKLTTQPSNLCTYTVLPGDSLWSIAESKLNDGSQYMQLEKLNNLTSSGLSSGQILKLPCNNQPETLIKAQKEVLQTGINLNVKVLSLAGTPMAGVWVTLHSKIQKALTDKNGVAHFTNIESGHHQVILAYNGYNGEQNISITGKQKDQTLTLKVQLTNIALTPIIWIFMSILIIIIMILSVIIFFLFKKRHKEKSNKNIQI